MKIHGIVLYFDGWTGEVLSPISSISSIPSTLRFKIPHPDGVSWTGSFGTPSTSVACILDQCEKGHIPRETTHGLLDKFQRSLRTGENRRDDFIIQPAPPFTLLQEWGGNLSLEAYHMIYDHDYQRQTYTQELDPETDRVSSRKRERNWRVSIPGRECVSKKVRGPSNLSSSIRFFRRVCGGGEELTLLLHPQKSSAFGVVLPENHRSPVHPLRIVTRDNDNVTKEEIVSLWTGISGDIPNS